MKPVLDYRSAAAIRQRSMGLKDSLTANFFAGKPALDIEKLQEDDRGIFVVPKWSSLFNSNL